MEYFKTIKTVRILLLIFLLVFANNILAQNQKQQSLYDRLGGVYAIASVVDDFIERLLVNDILNANPAINKARDRVPKAGLKFLVTAFVCKASGGPQNYTGRNMRASHSLLNITEKEWDAMLEDFVKTLNKFKVPLDLQQELIDMVNSTKHDILQFSDI